MDPTSPLLMQVTYSAIAVALLQKLKDSKWFPWLDHSTVGLNRAVAVILSGLTALGVTWTVAGTISAGYHLSVEIPSVDRWGPVLFKWLQSIVVQELIYRGTTQASNVQVNQSLTMKQPTVVVAPDPNLGTAGHANETNK